MSSFPSAPLGTGSLVSLLFLSFIALVVGEGQINLSSFDSCQLFLLSEKAHVPIYTDFWKKPYLEKGFLENGEV